MIYIPVESIYACAVGQLRSKWAKARDGCYMTNAEFERKCRGLAAREADTHHPGFEAQVQALGARAGEAGARSCAPVATLARQMRGGVPCMIHVKKYGVGSVHKYEGVRQ